MGLHRTTQSDFRKFKASVEYWLEQFGLTDWDVAIKHEDLEENAIGQASWLYRARCATISLSRAYESPVKDESVESTALHEVLELVLARLGGLAGDRTWDESEWEAERHAVIHRLMAVLEG